MVEQIDNFLELQQIDNDLDEAEKKKKNLPLKIVKFKKMIEGITNRVKIKSDEYKKLQVKTKRIELDLKEKVNKIDKHQNDLFGGKVSDIKELKQLQKVVAKYIEEKEEIEEKLLVSMEQVEDFNKIIVDLKEDLIKREENYKKIKKEIDAIILETNKDVKLLKSKRKELVGKIENIRFLKQYESLRRDKGGEVILKVNEAICSGCFLDLPSDVVYHLKRDKSIVSCPNCSRMLFWRE